ncbi:MAG: aminotransferase class I/II-fold pyridoxal phosphate-dependent enzyme [Chloroflexi bacterium]|nr:aminotransferase class I/II-fold pyridoxal phosphate-dependent enzyme [Chloroflexota bacterium]
MQFTTNDALREAGIVPLTIGDPDLATPGWIREAEARAVREGRTHYASVAGDPELREAIADDLNERHGQDFSTADILVTSGASSAIHPVVAAFADPGDEVILLNPAYSLYVDAIRLADAVAVWAPVRSDFHIDPEAIERCITPRTRLLMLNNPCNPTAVTYSRAELEAVERLAARHNLVVVADEVYDSLVYDGREFVSALSLPGLAERTVLMQSFSKTFAMTGWRVGYVAARGGLTQAITLIHKTAVGPINSMTQRAALVALRAGPETKRSWLGEMLSVYDRRRGLGQALLERIPRVTSAIPEATFYFWVKVQTSLSSNDLIVYLQDVGRVAVRSGTEFGTGGEGYVRLTFSASDDDLREGIGRMGEALATLDR